MPEYWRMLDQEARYGDDPRRHLHARLRLLQREDRHAASRRLARTRTYRDRRGEDGADPHRHHLGRPRRPARRRREPVREGHPGAAPRNAADDDRDSHPRFPQQARKRGRGDRRCASRRLQPQSRNRAAALSDDPPRRALLCIAPPARKRQAPRSVDFHEVGHHDGPRRGADGGPSGDGTTCAAPTSTS